MAFACPICRVTTLIGVARAYCNLKICPICFEENFDTCTVFICGHATCKDCAPRVIATSTRPPPPPPIPSDT